MADTRKSFFSRSTRGRGKGDSTADRRRASEHWADRVYGGIDGLVIGGMLGWAIAFLLGWTLWPEVGLIGAVGFAFGLIGFWIGHEQFRQHWPDWFDDWWRWT